MEYNYKNYYYYSTSDPNCEPLGECRAGTIGIAMQHFASTKRLEMEEFAKIYTVGIKNESRQLRIPFED
jgi:hypothetical protein